MSKPPFAYYGGKTRLAPRIAALLPPHQHYVEPFAGSLAVLLAKDPSKLETVNDLDGDLMTFWRVLRDQPEDLARVCDLTPHARSEHAAAAMISEDLPDLERARRVWVRLTQGRSSAMRNTGWRYYQDPAGTSSSFPRYLHGYVQRMALAANRIRAVSLESRPALQIIERYGKHSEVLIYADPPYERSTRDHLNYRHEMASADEHRELAAALKECSATVVLSGYHSPLYDELYAGWERTELAAWTGNATNSDGSRTEVLWSNRPLAMESAPRRVNDPQADSLFGEAS
jgi:DNA adenine methylase